MASSTRRRRFAAAVFAELLACLIGITTVTGAVLLNRALVR